MPEELYAVRNVEVAARLEYMAEARGMPRPGHLHADAQAEDSETGKHGHPNVDKEMRYKLHPRGQSLNYSWPGERANFVRFLPNLAFSILHALCF